ncbi:MAG: hypothetical protein M3P24_11860, partial [Gemmatimonadota bacterium]|nr:hypothetical protein [Gemmatimonadota bacterium]
GVGASRGGAFLAGFACVAAAGTLFTSPAEYGLGAAALGVGLWAGLRIRRAVWVLLFLVWIADLVIAATS